VAKRSHQLRPRETENRETEKRAERSSRRIGAEDDEEYHP